jgi:hypothetical protein
MHRRVHEVPHTGGASSLRATFHHDGILRDAEAKLAHLDWSGVAMMEYRLDEPADQFWFVELNPRFWGSLHLGLACGCDIPAALLAERRGARVRERMAPERRAVARWTFPRDAQYVFSRLRDRDVPLAAKVFSIFEFFWLGLDPRITSDLAFPGDRSLYWIEFRRFLADIFSAVARRLLNRGRNP